MGEMVLRAHSGAPPDEHLQTMVSREEKLAVSFVGHVCLLGEGMHSLRLEQSMRRTLVAPRHTSRVSLAWN